MSVDLAERAEPLGEAEPAAAARPRTFPERVLPERRRPALNPPFDEVLALVRNVAPADIDHANVAVRGARIVLTWLLQHPGESWQERWESSGADDGVQWIAQLVAEDPRAATTARLEIQSALYRMMLCRLIFPSYDFLNGYVAGRLFQEIRKRVTPDLFARLPEAADELRMHTGQKADGIRIITKIVIHAGKGVDELTTVDLYEYREWRVRRYNKADRGMSAAWDMLRKIGVIEDVDLRADLRRGQQSNEQLIDYYNIKNPQIRELLIRYLDERRPAMDYSSLRGRAFVLADLFWRDIEQHHPEQKDLRLSAAVYEGWRERVGFRKPKPGQPPTKRKDTIAVLTSVRAFYLDIQEWAQQDPYWAQWAVPCPVRRRELAGQAKHKRKVQAEIHQRIRERMPHMSVLVAAAEDYLDEQNALLAAATGAEIDETFSHAGTTYRRIITKAARKDPRYHRVHDALIENTETGERIDVEESEEEAFWAWAMTETLRHTGIRIEELSEITMLSLISYRLPKTGEIVPMLQIVPSKSNQERLLLVSPELASALARIVSRLRARNEGEIPLVERYDAQEKVTDPPLPHLFQHKRGWINKVFSYNTITRLLNVAVARAGVTDAAGRPLRYTAHDFRRIFTTEAVASGLPVHIAAKILGHANLSTTQHYLAVFQDDLITAYRAFLARRRGVRPEAEYREPTAEEWQEFQNHFELRKVSLGTCGRPYGTPCQHEHACIRCPMLQVDPRERPRLVEILRNLQDRITEAEAHGWLGEAEGLNVSLEAGKAKLTALDRSVQRRGKAHLGMPTLPARSAK